MNKATFGLLGAAASVALALLAEQPHGLFAGAEAKTVASAKQFRLVGLFDVAFEWVRTGFVEKPDDSKLIETAINGMLAGLENSYYLDAKALSHPAACAGSGCASALGNVGIAFTIVDGLPKVITPIDDTPAAKAGLLAGDIIATLDGNSVEGLTYFQVAERLRGNVGSTLRVEIARPGQKKLIVVPLVRENITPRSVTSRVDGGDVGYIRIAQFNEQTEDQLKKAIGDIAAQITPANLKGYIVDLRDNPGGEQQAAIAAANAFLENGDIVSIRGRKTADNHRFRAKGGDLTHGKKMAALINGGTASLAEVVAGALKDNHRATLIGTRSFGEGSVATLIPLGPGKGALRLATGHYLTPSGVVIETNGISPDVNALQDPPADLKTDSKPDDSKPDDSKQPPLQSYIPPDPKADKALTVAYDLLRQ